MTIRFCMNNKGSAKVAHRLRESFPNLDVKVRDCVKKCGPCRKTPFAVVNGRTVCGTDGEDLYRNILEALSEPP